MARMRFLFCLFLPTIIVPICCFANIVGRQVVAKESANGQVYVPAGVATPSSYTASTRSSVQPTHGRNASFATSRNVTGGPTSRRSRASLRGSRAGEPTGLAVLEGQANSILSLSSSRPRSNKFSASPGIAKWSIVSSYTSQGSQTTTGPNTSTNRNEVILAHTTSTFASNTSEPSAASESFSATSGLTWSRESVHAQSLQVMSSNSKNYSARISTSSYSASEAAVLGNDLSTINSNFSSEQSSVSSSSHTLTAVTSVPGPNGDITTSRRESRSSLVQSRAGAAASTAATTENKDFLATTVPAKAATASMFTSTETSVGSWPATITFCSLSDGVACVGVGYVTTLADGKSSITNTSPSQSAIPESADAGCAGEVAVFSDGLTTTIQLSTLPSATTFLQDGAQVETQSGTAVEYIPETLSGYNNAQPIEISTNFVEVIDGHTTTQGGWWLIGPYGHIEIPKNRPWNTGKGIGCIGGPALCDMPCGVVDVGLDLFVHIDHDGCSPDETGPPGYPGGTVGINSTPDPPYPQNVEGSDDGEKTGDSEEKTATNEEESTTTAQHGTATSRPRSITSSLEVSSATQISSSSASATEYLIVAAVGADQASIQQVLRVFSPENGESYEPDVGDTSVSGGTWVDYELTPYEAEQLSSRSDILAVVTCATVSMFGPGSSPSAPPQTVDTTVSLVTLPSSPATLPTSVIPKHRRGDVDPRSSSGIHAQTKTKVDNGLQKRDLGTRLVRQKRTLNTYPENLSVYSWAPGVPSIAGVDYIFEETKGDNTWVYLVDTGVAYRHWEFQNNWPLAQGLGKTNIDEDWIYAPGVPRVRADYHSLSHGTCMASRICGKRSGVAKQTTVIPVVISARQESLVAGLQQILDDITERRGKGQCLPGKTVVTMSLNIPVPNPVYVTLLSDAIKGIMNLGVVVVCSAGNDGDDPDDDWESIYYPAALAKTKLPWLFRIGAVDNKGILPDWAQKGDVYAPGVNALCAEKDGLTLEEQSDGSSGSCASMAGEIVYEMGKETCPFDFSGKEEDYPEYQRIVKQYYTDGAGAYVRPGGVWRVAWNGLDGRASTLCPLNVQKRDGESDEDDDTCAQPSSASSSTTVQTSTSTFSAIISSKPTTRSPNAPVLGAPNLPGWEIASLAAAIASSSSAAAAASFSASAAAASSLSAMARVSSSTFSAIISSKPTTRSPNAPVLGASNLPGWEIASLAAAIASSSSAAAAASFSASAAAASSLSAMARVSSSSKIAAALSLSAQAALAAKSPSPTSTPAAPSPMTFVFPLTCTLLDELVPGGRAPLIIHTRTCNDRSKPTATVSGDEYVCPSQVEVVIRG